MMKHWVAALGLAVAAGSGIAQAQTPTEATRWLISGGRRVQVEVINAGARPARVMVQVRVGQNMTRVGDVAVLQPGAVVRFSEAPQAGYAVVVSDEPVVASATAFRSLEASQQQSSPQLNIYEWDNSEQNYQGRVRYLGRLQSWDMGQAPMTITATPINCANAPAGHYVCGLSLPRVSNSEGQTAPRPNENLPAPGPSRQPEGRYTASPGAIPGNGPRLTPAPAPTPRRPR